MKSYAANLAGKETRQPPAQKPSLTAQPAHNDIIDM